MTNEQQDPYEAAEQEMGFGGDEPTHFLRLKNEGDTEIVIFKGLETVPANQKEMRKGYHKDGNVVRYDFVSPITGNERNHRTSGQALMIGLKNAVSFERDAAGNQTVRNVMPGEPCRLERSGSEGDTRIKATILSTEEINEYVKANTPTETVAAAPTTGQPSTTVAAQPTPQPSTTTEVPSSDIPPEKMDTETQSDENIRIEDIPF